MLNLWSSCEETWAAGVSLLGQSQNSCPLAASEPEPKAKSTRGLASVLVLRGLCHEAYSTSPEGSPCLPGRGEGGKCVELGFHPTEPYWFSASLSPCWSHMGAHLCPYPM